MSLFVRVDCTYWTNRKTIRLKAMLGEDSIWLPIRLWCYAAQNQNDGDFSDYDPRELAMLLGYSGDATRMLEALHEAGFMDGRQVHDWAQYNGYHAAFAARAKKAADARWSKAESKKKPVKKEKEKRGEEKRQALLGACLEHAKSIGWAYSSVFSDKLARWIDCRMAQKAPKNGDWKAFFCEQIEWMKPFGDAAATEVMAASIRNGWQGLFPPKQSMLAQTAQPPRPMGVYDAEVGL